MISTETRKTAHKDVPSRRLAEIRELEALWAVPLEVTEAPLTAQSSVLQPLRRHRVGLALAAAWITFIAVLLALGPSADAAVGPPGWAEQVAGVMLTVLLLAPLGVFNRIFGYGASSIAGLCGISLAVNCFTQGHTGFWTSYQLAGFGALAAISAATLVRSRHSR